MDQLPRPPPKKLALVNHHLQTLQGLGLTLFFLLNLLFDLHSQHGFRKLAIQARHPIVARPACARFLTPVGFGQDFRKVLLRSPLGWRRLAEGREAIIHGGGRGH
jgi:hypothetical protein